MKKITYKLPMIEHTISLIVLVATTICTYWSSLHYPFQFDDLANITKHFEIRHHKISELFFSGTRWISYWLNALYYSLVRFDPFLYRLGNVCIHLINGLLIYYMIHMSLSLLKRDSWYKAHSRILAFLTALFFLLHPVQTQTISYVIQGQLEGLATLSMLIALICFLNYTRTASTATSTCWLSLLYIVSLLSCGTKEITIILPALLGLTDWFFVAQGNWTLFKKRILLHASLSTMILAMYMYFLKPSLFLKILGLRYEVKNNLGNVITQSVSTPITPYYFGISQFKVILHYLFIFIWPYNISVEYDWIISRSFFAIDSLVPFATLALCIGWIVYTLKKTPSSTWCFGPLWFAIAMAPRSTIMPSSELLVDYKTYTASIGWLFFMVIALVKISEKAWYYLVSSRKNNSYVMCAQVISIGVFVFALSFSTIQRNKVWSSGINFWINILKSAPQKARAHNNYGVELSQIERFADAIPYFKRAIELDSNYPDPCNNLAVCYGRLGKIDLAIEALRHGLSINRYHPEAYNNLASLYIQQKNYDLAKRALEIALKLRPTYGKALFNFGLVYLHHGELENAWECFRACCTSADLDNEMGFMTYGELSIKMGKYEAAVDAFKRVLAVCPTHLEAHIQLTTALNSSEKYSEALQIILPLVNSNFREWRVWHQLGESYWGLDDPQNALSALLHAKGTGQAYHPHILLRIASCYEKLNRMPEAIEALNDMLSKNIATDVREKITQLRKQMMVRYNVPDSLEVSPQTISV